MLLIATCDASSEVIEGKPWYVAGYVIRDFRQILITKTAVDLSSLSYLTVNIAEYSAVYAAITYLIDEDLMDRPISIRSDSLLVINQLNGVWGCNEQHLQQLCDIIIEKTKYFKYPVEFRWIPRTANTEADIVSRSLYPVSSKIKHKEVRKDIKIGLKNE